MQMKVAEAVQTLVRMSFPRFSPKDQVLWVNIDARANYYGSDEGPFRTELKELRDIHILFHRPHNYTKVFFYVEKNDFVHLHNIPQEGWKLESDHDSCWTSDGLDTPLNKIYWDMRDEFPKDIHNKISWHINFSVFGGVKIFKADLNKIKAQPYPKYHIAIGECLKKADN